MTNMLIPNRPPKGKSIDEILAGMPKEGGQVEGQQLPKADSDLEFWFYPGDFWDATQAMERDGAVYEGAPMFIQERINAAVRKDGFVWENGCWPGELTVTNENGLLVLPPKIARQYAEPATLERRRVEYLVLPQDEYTKLLNASTIDVKKAIDKDLPFWISRERFCDNVRVGDLHESPFAVRVCGGIEETKMYAARLKEVEIGSIKHQFAEKAFVQKQGGPVVLGLWVGSLKGKSCLGGDGGLRYNEGCVRGGRLREQKIQTGASK